MLVNLGLIIIFANRNNSEKNLGPIALPIAIGMVRAPKGPIALPIAIGMVRAPKGPIAQLVRAPDS